MRFEEDIHRNLIKIHDQLLLGDCGICAVTGSGDMVYPHQHTRCSDVCGELFPRLEERTDDDAPSRNRRCPCNTLTMKWKIKRLERYFKECKEERKVM